PAGLPARAITAARGSVGGAVIAAHHASQAGLAHLGSRLKDAAVLAFLHSLAGGCIVAGGVAGAGALSAAFLLPAGPRSPRTQARPLAATDTAPRARVR